MSITYNFHHVHLRCEDLESAVVFYQSMLNGNITERTELRGMQIVRMEVGGEKLFLSPKTVDMNVEGTSSNPRWGVYQLAFTVENIDEAVEALTTKGAELQIFKPAGLPIAFFKGPDNVQIELMQQS